MGHWKNRWIQTPQRILMDSCIKQAPVLSKQFWIIPWPLAYNRLELDCIRKIINFWYTFGWKWRVFVTIWDCRTHVHMTSMTSSVERTDLDFKISVALLRGKGRKPLGNKLLMSTESPYHFDHLLQVSNKSLWILILYTFFNVFPHVYSPGQGQTSLCGQNPDFNRKFLSLCPFVESFQKISLKSDFIHNFSCFYI